MSPGRPARLTREQVALAALEIADREGVDAVSMRRVADSLGVGTMTLYGYFRDKQELLDAVLDAAVEGGELTVAAGPWRDRLRELVYEARRTLLRHPGLVQIRLRHPVLRPEALRFAEAVVSVLLDAGFEKGEAAKAFRLLFTYCLGFAGLSPAETTAQARRDAAAALSTLPPADYPSLTSAAAAMSEAMAGDEPFAFGLERILDGLEAQLDQRA